MTSLLLWFDESPARYWALACAAMGAAGYLAFRPLLGRPAPAVPARGDWAWAGIILLVLLAARWPYLVVSTEINADETQMLAGTITLRSDPVFWRSVDGNTAGPLDFYALLPASWICGPVGYLPARITSLLVLGAALGLFHAGLARLAGRTAARIASLPTLAFVALTTHRDFTHYSTEQVPLLLLAAAFYLAATETEAARPRLPVRLGVGLLLGAVPLAKLQGIPLGFALAALLALADIRRPDFRLGGFRNAWLAMVAGALVPATGFGLMACATGEWDNALFSYIEGNFSYAETSGLTLGYTIDRLVANVAGPGDLAPWWLGGVFVFLLGATAVIRGEMRRHGGAYAATAALVLVGLFTVLAPKRPYAHYLFFLVPPILLAVAAGVHGLLAEWSGAARARRALVVALLIVAPLAVLAGRAGRAHPYVGLLAVHHHRPPSDAVQLIGRLTHPGDAIAVWGWMSSYHVETGRRQALRESHSDYQITPGPLQAAYRQRYLADLRRAQPALFVDATGPGNFKYANRTGVAHDESFPELAEYVRAHYTLVAEANGSRLYQRNDRVERTKL